MDMHQTNEEVRVDEPVTEPEDIAPEVEESVPKQDNKKEKKARRPMALWQKVAMWVSLAVCVAAIGIAACVWVVGQPLILSDMACLFRLVKCAAISLTAVGGTMLFNGIVTLRWRVVWRVLLSIFGALLLLLGIALSTWKWWVPQLVVKPIVEDNVQVEEQPKEEDVAVTPDLPPTHNVLNIALFGVDQEEGSVGRSDTMIIVSIDKDHGKIKMTSLARDSLVPIDGHGEEKLTHAWAYGHAKLALRTINQNFGMNITEYAYVNFEEFIKAIDYLGGVYVNVDAAERDRLNQWDITHKCKIRYGRPQPLIEGTGRMLLNGVQALAYARNRSDGDGNRTARQREVLTSIYEQMKTQSLTKLSGTISQLLRLCHTTLTADEMTDLAMWALEVLPTVENFAIPNNQFEVWNGILDKQRGWVRVFDLEAATQSLHNFIYESDVPITDAPKFDPSTTTTETATTTAP